MDDEQYFQIDERQEKNKSGKLRWLSVYTGRY